MQAGAYALFMAPALKLRSGFSVKSGGKFHGVTAPFDEITL
jgi:hypothetical protein